jgi:hypothetical protein
VVGSRQRQDADFPEGYFIRLSSSKDERAAVLPLCKGVNFPEDTLWAFGIQHLR